MKNDNVKLGIVFMLAAVAVLSFMDGILKFQALRYPVLQVLFFRYSFGLLPVLLIAARHPAGFVAALRPARPWVHAVRALCALIALGCFAVAVRELSLANATTLFFAGPIFLTSFSIILLKDKLTKHRGVSVVIGFLGVLVALRPDTGIVHPAAVLVLIGAIGYAVAQILARAYASEESGEALTFWINAGAGLVTLAALPFVWQPLTSATSFGLFVTLGLLGGIGLFFMNQSLRFAPPPALGPYEYTAVPWAVLIDWQVWGVTPDLYTLTGCVLIVISGLYLLRGERETGDGTT